jgi:hypothetical protein
VASNPVTVLNVLPSTHKVQTFLLRIVKQPWAFGIPPGIGLVLLRGPSLFSKAR